MILKHEYIAHWSQMC